MVFLPNSVFLEFIPYEQLEHANDKDYKLSTVLLDELEEGKLYEVVITQLYGMPLLRYRMGDVIKVIALKDKESQVNLPHIVIQRRVGETIDLAGLAKLDEKIIWKAIANTGIKYVEWSALKDYDQNKSFLRIYLELKKHMEAAEVERRIDEQLRIIDIDYKDIDDYLDLQPVRVTLFTPGTFQRYMDQKVKEGADLAHTKPAHVNPSEAVIKLLLQLSKVN
jgi:phenylacetate-coenzyme A ligase PaaK-like adenylate-forming protein